MITDRTTYFREYSREYRRKRKEQGLCTCCKNETTGNNTRCLDCRIKHSIASKKWRDNNQDKVKGYREKYKKMKLES